MNTSRSRFTYAVFLGVTMMLWLWLGYFEAIEAPYVGF